MSDRAHGILASVFGSPSGGLIADSTKHRRYASALRTSTTLGAREDSRIASIFYEVGRRDGATSALLAATVPAVHRIDTSYDCNSAEAEFFIGLSKKYSNFSGSFARASFAGVVYRLALALAVHSVNGDVDSDAIRGNSDIRVTVLSAADTPVTSLTNAVFIPRAVDSMVTRDVWGVLVNAVAGEGSAVVTDVLQLETGGNRAIIPRVPADSIAGSIVSALQLMGANMVLSGQGPLFAFALTKGIHSVLSVVAHSDEGGTTRDLLRLGAFAPPFGGINPTPPAYTGLPSLVSSNAKDVGCYVDALAVTTAAAVAHCDPGQMVDGVWFPQFFVAGKTPTTHVTPGDAETGTAAMAMSLRDQVVAASGQFAALYMRALGEIFSAPGDPMPPALFFSAASGSYQKDPRHLQHASATPWFWVEPTSILPPNLIGSDAEAAKNGSLAPASEPVDYPALEGLSCVGGDFLKSFYTASVPSARRAPLLYHFWGNSKDGVAALTPLQMDVGRVVQPGAGPAGTPSRLYDRMEAAHPLSAYLWVRGQSPLPAPGELLNPGCSLGFRVQHVTVGPDLDYEEVHMYSRLEFAGARVQLLASRPAGQGIGPANAGNNLARRARTRAAVALAAVKRRVQIFGAVEAPEMSFSPCAPALGPRSLAHPVDAAPPASSRSSLGSGLSRPAPAPTPTGPPLSVTVNAAAATGPIVDRRPTAFGTVSGPRPAVSTVGAAPAPAPAPGPPATPDPAPAPAPSAPPPPAAPAPTPSAAAPARSSTPGFRPISAATLAAIQESLVNPLPGSDYVMPMSTSAPVLGPVAHASPLPPAPPSSEGYTLSAPVPGVPVTGLPSGSTTLGEPAALGDGAGSN